MRTRIISLFFAVVVLVSAIFPASAVFSEEPTGQDKTAALENLTASITQNGQTITDNDKMNSKDPIHVEISFGIPVQGDEPTPEVVVNKGDTATFQLSKAFSLISGTSIPLSQDGEKVATVTLVSDPSTQEVTANVVFDGADDIFSVYNNVSARFEAQLQYDASGDNGSEGDHLVTILNKTYTVTVPPAEIIYSFSKKGTPDLAHKLVNWEVDVEATQSGNPIDLKGYTFRDDLAQVGDYVDGSFMVNAAAAQPDLAGSGLTYTFPDNSPGPQTITFQTAIPDGKYYANGNQSISNTAQLINDEDKAVQEGSASVQFTPVWITKSGAAGGEYDNGVYDSSDRTITWTITANQMGAGLDNLTVTDPLPAGLTFKSAKWQQSMDGNTWTDLPISIPAAPDGGEYTIPGTTGSQVRLIIVSKVDETGPTTSKTTFTNTAGLSWDGMPTGVHPSTGNTSVTIGYDAISKTGTIDYSTQKIHWTVNADAKGQPLPDLKVYDLLVYQDQNTGFDINKITGLPSGLKAGDLTPRYNQKYAGGFSGDGALNEIAVYQDGNQVGDLLEISGLSTSAANSFSYDSQIVNPDIFAGNKVTQVSNTAALFNGTTKLNDATGSVNYDNKLLAKEMLKREAMSDPAAGVNSKRTTAADQGFDYVDKTVIFRLSVNADSLNFTTAKNSDGQQLGTATVTDDLPAGWEFVDIAQDKKFLAFEGTGGAGGSVNAIDTTPDDLPELTADIEGGKATFTFDPLTKPYVILVKAKPDDTTLAGYFSDNKTSTMTNTLALSAENWSGGVSVQRNVTIQSQLLNKTLAVPEAGTLNWTVDYNPYNLSVVGGEIEDTMPIGLELRTDAQGKLLLDGNMTAAEMSLKPDGTLEKVQDIPLIMGDNVAYDNASRTLTFSIPDQSKAYRFTYLTDITGDPGTVTNQVRLTDGHGHLGLRAVNYSISSADGAASFQKNGWIEITKTDGSAGIPGAKFTLFSEDGSTIIRQGISGADGKVRLKVIPDGTYVLKETEAPAGYTLSTIEHQVEVTTSNGNVATSVDGKTGTGSNLLTVANYLTGTAGNLSISKTVAGNDGDLNKKFDFTVVFDGASGSYPYTQTSSAGSVGGGTIKSGDVISLAHGEGIVISGLPKETKYAVTEADYTADGYVTVAINATGEILADDTVAAVFTNTKDKPGSLVISKTVAGNAGDPGKKFDFTVKLDGAPGTYTYTGTGGASSGTLKDGDTLSLAHGQSITIAGLPKDTHYTITEADYSKDGYQMTSIGATGVIKTDEVATAAFVNTKNVYSSSVPAGPAGPSTGSLTVSKTVAGNAGDRNKKFDFTIHLNGLTDAYNYIGSGGAAGGALHSGDIVSLSDGQSITITGLPAGTGYAVAEADYSAEGYSVDSTGADGVIQAGTVQVAAFINTKNGPSSSGASVDDQDNQGDNTPPGSNEPQGEPGQTGNSGNHANPSDPGGIGAPGTHDNQGHQGGEAVQTHNGTPKTGDSSARQIAQFGLIFSLLALAALVGTYCLLWKKSAER